MYANGNSAKVSKGGKAEVDVTTRRIVEDAVRIEEIGDVYVLKRRLGEGATATVYAAQRKSDGKEHALKATQHNVCKAV